MDTLGKHLRHAPQHTQGLYAYCIFTWSHFVSRLSLSKLSSLYWRDPADMPDASTQTPEAHQFDLTSLVFFCFCSPVYCLIWSFAIQAPHVPEHKLQQTCNYFIDPCLIFWGIRSQTWIGLQVDSSGHIHS